MALNGLTYHSHSPLQQHLVGSTIQCVDRGHQTEKNMLCQLQTLDELYSSHGLFRVCFRCSRTGLPDVKSFFTLQPQKNRMVQLVNQQQDKDWYLSFPDSSAGVHQVIPTTMMFGHEVKNCLAHCISCS